MRVLVREKEVVLVDKVLVVLVRVKLDVVIVFEVVAVVDALVEELVYDFEVLEKGNKGQNGHQPSKLGSGPDTHVVFVWVVVVPQFPGLQTLSLVNTPQSSIS